MRVTARLEANDAAEHSASADARGSVAAVHSSRSPIIRVPARAAELGAVGRQGSAMGVTIHFEGRLRDGEGLKEAIATAEAFARQRGWPIKMISAPERRLTRVRDEQKWDYVGPVKGVALYPSEDCEPVRLEFDRDLYLQEFTKTQFAGATIHISIVQLLRDLEPLFAALLVEDEGEYWDTSNLRTLEGHLKACDAVLDEIVSSRPAVRSKVKLPSGRIIDYMT